ncbi:putative membrane protein [Peptoniphilus sp. ING2-D1G]|nr:putative membrane protein [Peptoniphilus sp. ING2-D1G]
MKNIFNKIILVAIVILFNFIVEKFGRPFYLQGNLKFLIIIFYFLSCVILGILFNYIKKNKESYLKVILNAIVFNIIYLLMSYISPNVFKLDYIIFTFLLYNTI